MSAIRDGVAYISGPMSGYPDFNRGAFTEACGELRAYGVTVVSPHEVGEEPGKTWADYIRKDLVLLAQADMVVTLPGWECSRGACLEVHIAHALGMPVVPLAVATEQFGGSAALPKDPT